MNISKDKIDRINDKFPLFKYIITNCIACVAAIVILIFSNRSGRQEITFFIVSCIIYFIIRELWQWHRPLKKSKHYLQRAQLYIDINKKDKALELLKAALKIEKWSEKERNYIMGKMVSIYSKKGLYDEAIAIYKTFEQSAKTDLDKVELNYKIGIYYYFKKDYANANIYFERSCEGLINTKKKVDKDALEKVIDSYILENKKYKAESLYKYLLQNKLCKKNSEVEERFK
jgi:tetratricopeptide (TPR) repeat protein